MRTFLGGGLIRTLALLLFTGVLGAEDKCHISDPIALAVSGGQLSESQAGELEAKLLAQPFDLPSRTSLLGYYFLRSQESKSCRRLRQQHILWVIQNCPASQLAGSFYAELDPTEDGLAYEEGKQKWLEMVEHHRGETAVLGNAAEYLSLGDRATAVKLLEQAAALERGNAEWFRRLGLLYELDLTRAEGAFRVQAANKALHYFETAYSLSGDTVQKTGMLPDLSRLAFESGNLAAAEKYAGILLSGPGSDPTGPFYGNAVHHANITLGRVMLRKGDMHGAAEHLLAAGHTPGSPQLASFGPNMALAADLLKAGDRQVVLSYLQLCARFWNPSDGRLKKWIATVRAGGTPYFGANMLY